MSDDMPLLWAGDYPAVFAARYPGKAAIIHDGRTIDYAALDAASHAFARLMQKRGVRRGQRIAYLGRNSDLYFAALFGCIHGGFVLVPINWRLAPAEIAVILADSEAALLIVDSDMAAAHDLPIILTEAPANSLRAALSRPATGQDHRARDWQDAVCLQLYTSGTTGPPKGVLITHRTLSLGRHSEFLSPHWRDFTGIDIILSPMPNFHAGGLTWMLMGLARGCTCVLTGTASAANIIALCDAHAVTRLWVPPTVIRALVDLVAADGALRLRLAMIHYGGEAMRPALLDAAIRTLGCGFGQFYGMTETGGAVVTYLPAADHDLSAPGRLASIGTPMPGMEIAIRAPDGHDLLRGEHGEIHIRSEALMSGYWQRPDAEREALAGGWYRTGDGGYVDQDGYLFLTHRIKDMIISGGENVYAAEVEDIVRQFPGIGDVAIVGIADARWGETVVAVVEVATPIDEAALVDFVRARLAAFKTPRRVLMVDSLPRTASGKVNRAAARQLARATYAAPAHNVQ